ncbi:MAG TPA: ComEA family DNA-binding protein [Acidimicrobiia bacterium]|nr:ComEA family DNA-binding protein [Acidimicrobiia bacterium]
MSEVEAGPEVDVVPRPPAPEPHPVLQWVQQTRRNPRFALGAVAVVALSAGVALWRAGQDETPARPPAEANAAFVTTTTAVAAPAVVHVVGAVRAPGVVELGAHARVVDAIGAAGGATDDADLQRLNLAALVTDGQRIAVPRVGEPDPAPALGDTVAADGGPTGPIDVNTATEAQLETLPGIGPSLAAAIVAEREKGPFKSVDDLGRVRGIGDARLDQLRELVTVSG